MTKKQSEAQAELGFKNPGNYRKLSVPFESPEKANEALEAFWDELYELRNKYHFRDLHVILGFSIMYPEGESDLMATLHAGDPTKTEAMTAYAYGRASADRQELMGRLLAQGVKKQRDRP